MTHGMGWRGYEGTIFSVVLLIVVKLLKKLVEVGIAVIIVPT